MNYILFFLAAAILSILITPHVKRFAVRYGFVDVPNNPRKIHKQTMPRLGGLAIYIVFAVVALGYMLFGSPDLELIPLKFFIALLVAGAILVVGGALDDKYSVPAKVSIIFPVLATTFVVFMGVGGNMHFISNPFGGKVGLDFLILGIPAASLFAWLWILGMIYTTKLLDGLDGLASGISLIGGLTLFFLSLTETVNQSTTATLAIIFSGSLAGYLIYAFNPASIFLGESGSTLLGFILGVLSVIAGAKVATALLVMGIPILDVAWAIIRRLLSGRSPFSADRQHLHFLLLDAGLSHRQVVLLFYTISAIFGFTAVFLQSKGKLIALGLLTAVMLALVLLLAAYTSKRKPLEKE